MQQFWSKVGSEGVSVPGVRFWRFGVPFGVRFGFLLAPFRGLFSGCLSGGVWRDSWGARHHSGEDEPGVRGGSGEDQGRMRGGSGEGEYTDGGSAWLLGAP